MLTFLVAAAAGWAVGTRSSPFTWIAGAVLIATLCFAVIITGWSFGSLVEGLVGLVAFNAIAVLAAIVRPRVVATVTPAFSHSSRSIR